ncbi:unnamed protein product [Parascedosporium putredinis]|uniref:Uncharacterized protein n=1 Tax=Parascedosporium putredinis TaxID=1442378 RepID=A0A9P1M9G6_9PEZI|nr:unnamed protein product [Parascedosporium putredinis]CAI7991987.1 unnamed protein product [Parascedosporium putredinis]
MEVEKAAEILQGHPLFVRWASNFQDSNVTLTKRVGALKDVFARHDSDPIGGFKEAFALMDDSATEVLTVLAVLKDSRLTNLDLEKFTPLACTLDSISAALQFLERYHYVEKRLADVDTWNLHPGLYIAVRLWAHDRGHLGHAIARLTNTIGDGSRPFGCYRNDIPWLLETGTSCYTNENRAYLHIPFGDYAQGFFYLMEYHITFVSISQQERKGYRSSYVEPMARYVFNLSPEMWLQQVPPNQRRKDIVLAMIQTLKIVESEMYAKLVADFRAGDITKGTGSGLWMLCLREGVSDKCGDR